MPVLFTADVLLIRLKCRTQTFCVCILPAIILVASVGCCRIGNQTFQLLYVFHKVCYVHVEKENKNFFFKHLSLAKSTPQNVHERRIPPHNRGMGIFIFQLHYPSSWKRVLHQGKFRDACAQFLKTISRHLCSSAFPHSSVDDLHQVDHKTVTCQGCFVIKVEDSPDIG